MIFLINLYRPWQFVTLHLQKKRFEECKVKAQFLNLEEKKDGFQSLTQISLAIILKNCAFYSTFFFLVPSCTPDGYKHTWVLSIYNSQSSSTKYTNNLSRILYFKIDIEVTEMCRTIGELVWAVRNLNRRFWRCTFHFRYLPRTKC